MAAINVEGVSKRYQLGHIVSVRNISNPVQRVWARIVGRPQEEEVVEDFWALKDIHFKVESGQVVGIIGKNGAGKSTLLKVLSRITDPTEGRIVLNGRVSSLLEVGTGFNPELTGRENIYLNGSILGMTPKEIQDKFDEIVTFAEVERFLDTPVKRYSSGMYVRLAFAVAAHLEPEILIVDEVLAVGDVAFQKKCLSKMDDISNKGMTVLFVSHNMSAIRKICGRCVWLDEGRIISEGPTDHVINEYLSSEIEASQAHIDLSGISKNSIGKASSLEIFTAEGKRGTVFRIGEKWRIKLVFEVYKNVEHLIAAISVIRVDDTLLFSYWSKPKDVSPGKYLVEFECDVKLEATELMFAVGLSSNEKSFYYEKNIGHVTISDIAVGMQPFRANSGAVICTDVVSNIIQVPN